MVVLLLLLVVVLLLLFLLEIVNSYYAGVQVINHCIATTTTTTTILPLYYYYYLQVNIIHRDLKPENVLLASDGHICITDFGLAKEIGDPLVNPNETRTLCGTSEYMAPEMLSRSGYGRPADWWSLGALFFEMLSGQAPFRAKTQRELDKKILGDKFIAPAFLTAPAVSLLKGLLDKVSLQYSTV
jgi:serine/threonine protein kinase